nr:hypothetical protein [Crocosphaera subtropica]
MSLGIAVSFPTTFLSTQTLFEKVDMALYRAKATGRNCYCLQTILDEED